MKQLFLILLIVPFLSFSQLSAEKLAMIDSLHGVIESAKHDTTVINAWKAWDNIIYIVDPDLDLDLNQKIDSLCSINLKKKLNKEEKYSFLKSKGFALDNIGIIYQYQGETEKSLVYYSDGLKAREEIGDKNGIASSLNNIGSIYKAKGNYDIAIEYYTKSLKIREEIGDKGAVSASLNNIGNIYIELKEIDKALEYHTKSLKIREEEGLTWGVAASYNNIGYIYEMEGEWEKAIEFYNKSIEKQDEIGNKSGVASALGNIGNVYIAMGDYDQALKYHQQSLQIREELGNKSGIAASLNDIGIAYQKQGNVTKAREFQEQSLGLAVEIGLALVIQNASQSLWSLNKESGRYKESLEMYELYISTRDSIRSEENQKALIQQEYKYAYEKQAAADSVAYAKEKEIAQVQIEKQDAELNAKRNQHYAMIGGLCMIGLFAGFMYNRFKVTRKQKGIIEDAHHELEEKNQEIMDSIAYAKRIQTAILPPPKLVKEYLNNSFILYKPKDVVAGDFYWMEPQKNRILFAAADCTGHGVPGAMVSVICNNGLNRSAREFGLTDPGEILTKTRDLVIAEFEKSEEEVKDGMDIALCSLEGNKLKYAGAHNPLWIIRKGATEVEEIKADKQPIGKYAEPKPFTTHELELNPGDTFYTFSDGYADQFGGDKGKKFKAANFKKLLLSIQNESMDRQRELIDEAFENWRGKLEQLDDICVIGVRV